MKLIILNILALTFALSAYARTPIAPIRNYEMKTLKIDGQLVEDTESMLVEGSLSIDHNKGEISAYAQQVPNCKPDQMCPKYLIHLMSANAKIVKVEQTACSLVYVAESNLMPVDGYNTQIIFETFEFSKCMFVKEPVGTATITIKGYKHFGSTEMFENVYEMEFN